MEANEIDPYAPPKSVATGTDNTTYLDQDGYAFNNELVANMHFKSPLICAKLGIPIPPETNPVAKEITIKRVPRFPPFIVNLTTLLSFCLLILCCFYMRPNNISAAIVLYIFAVSIINRLASKAYRIPFYFSQQYTHIRIRRHWIFLSIITGLIITFIAGISLQNQHYTILCLPALVITLFIYKFKSTLFIVTHTKGEFHYIRGVHSRLLESLPYLPISR